MRIEPGRAADFTELTRIRIVAMVVASGGSGYLIAARRFDPEVFVYLLVGVGLIVAAANTLNQILERDLDARMRRTSSRPLPARRLSVSTAVFAAVALLSSGLLALREVNPAAFLLGAVAVLIYALAYTPLKRITPLSLFVGAAAGALPPLIGTAAAERGLSATGLALFVFLFIWQVPHFLAIGWMHREDYTRAGFRVFSVCDRTGLLSGVSALVFAAMLPPLIWLAFSARLIGPVAAGLSAVSAAAFVVFAGLFVLDRTQRAARALFLASNGFLLVSVLGAATAAFTRLHETGALRESP